MKIRLGCNRRINTAYRITQQLLQIILKIILIGKYDIYPIVKFHKTYSE